MSLGSLLAGLDFVSGWSVGGAASWRGRSRRRTAVVFDAHVYARVD